MGPLNHLKGFSSKSRNTLTRKVRKFASFSGGAIDWREYSRGEEMAEFYELARAVSRKTYQEQVFSRGLPRHEQFCQSLATRADRGAARGYVLFFNCHPIGYLFCPIEQGILSYQYVGYDRDFQQWSPGTVLQYLVLEKLFAEGKHRMFDFSEGEGEHKRFFSTGCTLCADVFYFRRSLRNALLLRLHIGLRGFAAMAARAADRLGLKSAIKWALRSFARG